MSRGDGNLLFDPPRLIKAERLGGFFKIATAHSLPGPIYALYPEGGAKGGDEKAGFSVQRSEDDAFYLRAAVADEGGQEFLLENRDLFPLLDLVDTLAANQEGLLYFDGQDICLHSPKRQGDPERYPFSEAGQVIGLHAASSALYLLWQKHSGRRILSHFRRDMAPKVIDGKNALPNDTSYVLLENKGEKSVVMATSDRNNVSGEIDFLLTLGPDGQGHPHYLRQEVSLALRALSPSGERFLAPGKRDGSYFFLDPRIRENISFLREDGSVKNIAADIDLYNLLSLRSEGDRCLLLCHDSLVLLNEEEEIFRLDLPSGEEYGNLSFSNNRAFLWNQGGPDYLEVTLPDS